MQKNAGSLQCTDNTPVRRGWREEGEEKLNEIHLLRVPVLTEILVFSS